MVTHFVSLLALAVAAAPHAKPAKPAPAPSAAPSPAAVVEPARPALPAVATGLVRDAVSGEPLAGALVQQEGSVTSVFTQADGKFRILLDKTGGANLAVSALGFEGVSVAIGDGKDLQVKLAGVQGFMPAAPLMPLAPIGLSNAETAPLNSGLVFAYSMRNNAVSVPGAAGTPATIGGWSNNDFRLGARVRLRPWLVEAEGAHVEQPVSVAGLRTEENPAFKPSTWQAGARLGAFWAINRDLEAGVLGAYRWSNTVPNNNRVPYTGSDMDFEQTRHALGGYALAAWRPGRGRWHFELGGGYYPYVYAVADSPGQTFAQTSLVEARALLGYEFMPGFRFGLGGGLERWSGRGEDQALRLTAGIHYTPGGVPKGNE